jgi:cytochrome b6-f complex iron-sulfur subunit
MSESNQADQDVTALSRRRFVLALGACAAACACGGAASLEAAPADTSKSAAAGGIDIGKPEDFKDGISDKFLKSHKIAVVKSDGRIFACTAVCTHRRATLNVKDGKSFACPKHGSAFSLQGTVTKGPADSSLVRYAISKNDAGHLLVNTKKEFREKQWEDPASFVEVK